LQLDVRSGAGPYRVIVETGALAQIPAQLAGAAVVVVSSPPVWQRHGGRLKALVQHQPPILIPDGEGAKTLTVVNRLYRAFSRRGVDRAAIVVAFGGGVVGDVAGFAAATYLRGLRLVQVPTTLLAQVDSAIGGKVGVNLASGKNLVGAFHPPSLVVCDPAVLTTLPAREFRAGLFEVVKYGVIASRALFDHLTATIDEVLTQAPEATRPMIAESCRIKADVVGSDERESGPRRVLNFGHTIGHALETITGYHRFRHGEAIAHGMLAAADLSAARGLLPEIDRERLHVLIARVGRIPTVRDLRVSDALAVIRRDKKVVRGRLHFVLARGLGDTAIVDDVTDSELIQAMQGIGMR
jgi:3-dehydroquinate synthase